MSFSKKFRRFSRPFVFVADKILGQHKREAPSPVNTTNLDHAQVVKLTTRRIPNLKQLRRLPEVLTQGERLTLFILGAVILLSSVVWVASTLVSRRDSTGAGGDYVEALVGAPRYVNPILAQTDVDRDLAKLVFAGLFTFDGKNYVPGLAADYKISSDQKTYTIRLREGLKWHDGKPLTADDVIFTIETIKNPKTKSPLIKEFAGVTLEKINDLTVNFTFKERFAPFISLLDVGVIDFLKEKRGGIRSYALRRANNYYGDKPRFQKITFKFFADFETAINALKNHVVSGVSYVPRHLESELEKSSGITIYRQGLPQYTAIFINQKLNEQLRVKEVRRALAHALDRAALVGGIFGSDAGVIDAPIISGLLGFHPDIKKYPYDPGLANSLLEEAGFKFKSATGTIRVKNNKELKVSLAVADQPEAAAAGEFIKSAWEAVGVKVELTPISLAQIQKDVIHPRNFEALLFGETLSGDSDLYPFWHSSQSQEPGLNIVSFGNRETDKLLEETRNAGASEERAQKFIAFQNILAEELPAIFLWSPRYLYAVSDRVKVNLPENITTPADRFVFINKWSMKTFAK